MVSVSYRIFGHEGESVSHNACMDGVVADSGAQVCVMPLRQFVDSGFGFVTLNLKPPHRGCKRDPFGRCWMVGVRSVIAHALGVPCPQVSAPTSSRE